jgi:hypothetical protein
MYTAFSVKTAKTSTNEVTTPRSGLDCDGVALSTVTRTESRSPSSYFGLQRPRRRIIKSLRRTVRRLQRTKTEVCSWPLSTFAATQQFVCNWGQTELIIDCPNPALMTQSGRLTSFKRTSPFG